MGNARQVNRRRLLASLAGLAGAVSVRAQGQGQGQGQAVPAAAAVPAAGRPEESSQAVAQLADLGVELMGLRLSANDFLIDLRYRVKDVGKAQVLLEQKVKPTLVNESTGDRYYVPQPPKVGALKQSATSKQPALAGRVYFMLFANPDRRLKAGDKVTLYAGESVVRDIVVR
jgi:hypothetical protein